MAVWGAIEDADELRMKAFNRKKMQLQNSKAEGVVTACANCRIHLEDGLEENEIELPVYGLTEMIAEHLVED